MFSSFLELFIPNIFRKMQSGFSLGVHVCHHFSHYQYSGHDEIVSGYGIMNIENHG